MPVDDVLETDRSLADVDGIGSHWWAGVGLEGSSGGALIIFFGIEATGCECRTSFYEHELAGLNKSYLLLSPTQLAFGSRNLHHTPSSRTSLIFLQRFRNMVSIRFRRSMIPTSSLALVGLAA